MDPPTADEPELGEGGIEARHERLLSLARRLVSPGAGPEDLVQEAWVASLASGSEGETRPRRWMNGVMRNIASNQRARNRRRRDLEIYAWEGAESVSSSAGSSEAAKVLRTAVDELGEPYSTVLSRRYFDGASAEVIATEMGATSSTVRSQLSRGLQRLRASLDAKYGGRDAWASLLAPLGTLRPAAPVASTWSVGAMGLVAALLVVGIGALAVLLRGGDGGPEQSQTLADSTSTGTAEADVAAVAETSSPQGVRVELAAEETELAAQPASQEDPEPAAAVPVLDLMIDVLDESGLPEHDFSLRIQGPGSSERLVESTATPRRVTFVESDVRQTADDRFVLLTAQVPGSAPSLRAHVSLDVAPGTRIEFRTRGKACAGEILVKDPEGDPIADAVITLDAAGQEATPGDIPGVTFTVPQVVLETGANGVAKFAQEPLATRQMRVRASGYSTLDEFREVSGDGTPIVATLQRAGTLRGTVQLPGGAPAEGAFVRVVDPLRAHLGLPASTATTDADGAYELTDLRRQPEYVCVTLETADQPLFDYTVVDSSQSLDNRWDAQMEPHQGLRFRFVTETGSPLAAHRAFVVAERATFEWGELLTTDDDGVASCPYVPDIMLLVAFERGPNDMVPVARNTLPSEHVGQILEVVIPMAPQVAASLQGTIRGPDGVPEGSYLTGFQDDLRLINVGVDGVSGAFRADSVPPGHYSWFAVIPQRGAFHLGARDLEVGSALDFGVVELPPLVEIQVDWKGRPPTPERPWVLELGLSNDSYDPLVLRTIEEKGTGLALLPNRYVLRQEGGHVRQPFEVDEGDSVISVVIHDR